MPRLSPAGRGGLDPGPCGNRVGDSAVPLCFDTLRRLSPGPPPRRGGPLDGGGRLRSVPFARELARGALRPRPLPLPSRGAAHGRTVRRLSPHTLSNSSRRARVAPDRLGAPMLGLSRRSPPRPVQERRGPDRVPELSRLSPLEAGRVRPLDHAISPERRPREDLVRELPPGRGRGLSDPLPAHADGVRGMSHRSAARLKGEPPIHRLSFIRRSSAAA